MRDLRLIAAVDPAWVIGLNGGMPWHYKADFKRFKAVTMGSTLVMGRLTWESLPKPLPGRRCIVLSRQENPPSKHSPGSCVYCPDLAAALHAAESPEHETNGVVWFAGGAEIYCLALALPELRVVDLTVVPAVEPATLASAGSSVTYFPHESLAGFSLAQEIQSEEDPRLLHRSYERQR